MSSYDGPIVLNDEFVHTPEGGAGWRENWWLVFFDQARGIRGLCYSGIQPLSGRGFVLFGLFLNDRPLYVLDDDAVGENDYDHANGKVGPLIFTCLEPFERWQVTFETLDVSCDVVWTDACEAYDFDWGEGKTSRHYEQAGRVTGTIRVGDLSLPVEGMGQRDRAWGQRPNHAFRTAWSSRVLFGEDDVQLASIIGLAERTYLYGYRVKDGKATMFDRLALSPSYAYPGGPPISTELTAWSGDEVMADQQVRLTNVVPRLTVREGIETHQFFTFNRWFEGAKSAVGQMDHWWSTAYDGEWARDVKGNDGAWVKP